MSGSVIPRHAIRSFDSEVVTTTTVTWLGSTVALPIPDDPDTSLCHVLIVNRGCFAVRLNSITGPAGVTTLAGDIEVAGNTSRLFTDPLLTTATAYGMSCLNGGQQSPVDVHRGSVSLPPQTPSFLIKG